MPPEEVRAQIIERIVESTTEYSEQECLNFERMVLNFYISSHPVLQYQTLFSMFPQISFITPSQINAQTPGSRAIVLGLVEQKNMKTTKNGDPFLSLKIGDHMGSVLNNIWSPLATKVAPTIVDNQLVLLSGQIKEDKFRPGDNQLHVYDVLPINTTAGFPVYSFYGEDEVTCNRILTLLGAQASSISDKVLNTGCCVMLKELMFIKPEHIVELRKCGRAHYMLAI
jgi:DNA polymerase III alpha subunit